MAACFIIITILSLLTTTTTTTTTTLNPSVGITYTYPSPPHASPEEIIPFLERLNITSVRLPNPHPSLIRAFSYYSDISLIITIPNSEIPSLASSHSNAVSWLQTHVVPFYPRARISTISVGSDVFTTRRPSSDFLHPALINVYMALYKLGIHKISVSTTLSLHAFTTAVFPPGFPPPSAKFNEPHSDALGPIGQLLDSIKGVDLSSRINVSPHPLYRVDCHVPLGCTMLQDRVSDAGEEIDAAIEEVFDSERNQSGLYAAVRKLPIQYMGRLDLGWLWTPVLVCLMVRGWDGGGGGVAQ